MDTRECERDVTPTTAPEPAAAVAAAYAAGKLAWPDVQLSYERYCAHVGRWQPAALPLQAHGAEYYLCVACANGVPGAFEQLDEAYFPALEGVALRLLRDRSAADDVLQDVRARLFVASPPRIASYRGSGSLAGWLRRIVVRACQDQRRASLLRLSHQQQLRRWQVVASPSLEQGPEADAGTLRRQSELIIRQAWHAAIRSLGSAERRLLYHYFVAGHSIDVLSQLYSGHRATMARRIRRATERVSALVREGLLPHYDGLDSMELGALVRDCGRDMDLTEPLVLSDPHAPHAA